MKYKTAKQLGITPLALKYLKYAMKVLPKLVEPKVIIEGDKPFGFNMNMMKHSSKWVNDYAGHSCGTVGCIHGLMDYKATKDGISACTISDWAENPQLEKLFFPIREGSYRINNNKAAKVVKTFLTTGKVKFPYD